MLYGEFHLATHDLARNTYTRKASGSYYKNQSAGQLSLVAELQYTSLTHNNQYSHISQNWQRGQGAIILLTRRKVGPNKQPGS